ncbi:MAG: UbiH/UbiF/VisC/COQ6 family ubiquinone biosynthesis hydroxylase [Woeseia sp.]
MKREYDIVVIGAGITGLTAAALLTHSKHREQINVTVVDAGKRPAFDISNEISLRVSAIASGSTNIFASIDVWEAIESERVCPYRDMRVWDSGGWADGPDALRFDSAEFAVAELGFIIENNLICHALLGKLDTLDRVVHFETPIKSMTKTNDRSSVEFKLGKAITADLVIGADGADSLVRQSAEISVEAWRYPQTAFVTHLRPEFSHRHTAWQRFLRSGPIALLPLADGRVSVVWSTSPRQAEHAMAASNDELSEMLSEASGYVLGQLTSEGPRGSFPLKAQHANKYACPGLALIGDAAHAVHPLAGQGANLGLADAAKLVSVIDAAIGEGEHPGDLPVLRRYERARKGANTTMLYFIDCLNRLFSSKSSSIEKLRGSGMRLFNSSGPIREHAVQVALGIDAQ